MTPTVTEEQLARLREIAIAVFGPGPDVDHIARWLANAPPFTGDFTAWLAADTTPQEAPE